MANPQPSGISEVTDTSPEEDSESDKKGQEAVKMIAEYFTTNEPKHIGQGVANGAYSVVMGTVAGVAALVAAPIAGAKTQGAKGLFKGLAGGIALGVGLTVTGAIIGAKQIVQGTINSCGAVAGAVQGKQYDEKTGRWVFYNLPEEAELVLGMTEEAYTEYIMKAKGKAEVSNLASKGPQGTDSVTSSTEQIRRPPKAVKETEFYDILSVPTNASPEEIKKQYYKQALLTHPDKHPDDPEAEERFQKIGEAYQTLIDDNLRDAYDKDGKAGTENAPMMDPNTFFAMVFGTESFEPLVGEMKFVAMMHAEEETGGENAATSAHAHLKQWKREITLAINLANIIEPFVINQISAEEFSSTIDAMCHELAGTAFGSTLVGVLGYIYHERATKALGGVAAAVTVVRSSGHTLATKYRATKAMVKAARQASEMKDGEEVDPEHARQTMRHVLQVLWALSVLEIEGTVRSACQKILLDKSVRKKKRQMRAQGLLIMGHAFINNGGGVKDGLIDVGERMGLSEPVVNMPPEQPNNYIPSQPSQPDGVKHTF